MKSKKKDKLELVMVGSIGLDDIATPRESRQSLLGGSLSYACPAASFFSQVGMVGIVGSDFPERYVEQYRGFGIDLDGLARVEGKTFRWSGVYDADMINRRTISTELNVFSTFSPALPNSYRDAPFFLLGNISPDLQLHVLNQARKPVFVVADTMDLWIRTARKPLMDLLSKVHMLTLNDGEARLLTGEYNLRKCGKMILDWGPRYVVIKKGEHGAMLMSADGIFIVPAYPVDEVHDPTGAGDSFAGGFMGALAREGKTDEAAVRRSLLYGSVVASFSVQLFGADSLAGLTRDRIEERLTEFRSMIACPSGFGAA